MEVSGTVADLEILRLGREDILEDVMVVVLRFFRTRDCGSLRIKSFLDDTTLTTGRFLLDVVRRFVLVSVDVGVADGVDDVVSSLSKDDDKADTLQ